MQEENFDVFREGGISEALTERIRENYHVVNACSHQKNKFLSRSERNEVQLFTDLCLLCPIHS